MTTWTSCEECGSLYDTQYGGCESCEKQRQADAYEKKQRRKESSYHNNTGKYNKSNAQHGDRLDKVYYGNKG